MVPLELPPRKPVTKQPSFTRRGAASSARARRARQARLEAPRGGGRPCRASCRSRCRRSSVRSTPSSKTGKPAGGDPLAVEEARAEAARARADRRSGSSSGLPTAWPSLPSRKERFCWSDARRERAEERAHQAARGAVLHDHRRHGADSPFRAPTRARARSAARAADAPRAAGSSARRRAPTEASTPRAGGRRGPSRAPRPRARSRWRGGAPSKPLVWTSARSASVSLKPAVTERMRLGALRRRGRPPPAARTSSRRAPRVETAS